MLRAVKRAVSKALDWILYTLLKPSQKEKLSNLLTDNQKAKVKSVLKPGKKQQQVRKIERAKFKLYELGFYEKAIEELNDYFKQDENQFLKKLAGIELALWHANKYTEEGDKEALSFLEEVKALTKDETEQQRIAIMEAESLRNLGEHNQAINTLEPYKNTNNPDIFLAMANAHANEQDQLKWINKVYEQHNEKTVHFAEKDYDLYDRLDVTDDQLQPVDEEGKVSIIVPVYNAGNMIEIAIESLRKQTWRNLEIIVVDDCSQDDTYELAKQYESVDDRIKVIQTEQNGGAYTARNTALNVATGDFITINDADDWSHPLKIETQIRDLIGNPNIMGNFSQQARATERLEFYRRGKFGQFIFPNMSSFMFRKEVLQELGYWDQVRFGGDAEFVKRVKITYGEKSVKYLTTAPLSFQRQSSGSLTASSAFGFPGYFMGARREYRDAQATYHEQNPDQLKYDFPMTTRPFPVPEPMKPNREPKQNGQRHFDVIIVSEFRLLGGTNMSNIEEIKAQKDLGLKTGLVQLSRYELNSLKEMNPKVREQIDGEQVQLIVYGEKVSCDVLVLRHPPILEERQTYLPDIDAKSVQVIVNQTPKRDYSETGETLYEIPTSVKRLNEYFGTAGIWSPIGPVMRDALLTYHKEDLNLINLSDDDWINIINIDEWKREERPNHDKVVIGRHSRDHAVKWPTSEEELFKVYPNTDPYEVRILGGAKAPVELLGKQPDNWTIYQFGDMHPKEFLKDIDVFAYYTHPELKEAFGRVIFEAMAVGVPVILPPVFEPVFKEAAIYAETDEVRSIVDQLMADDEMYENQVNIAFEYVEKHFGYQKHADRLKESRKDV
ncbi:glycosyltransferase [Alkalibacillus haloalkaliphilus]|uniref:glycosyltransferase n=1 Tax=Alkalibacillus haloalkaliphilus TaxID=94136 RepID=UPI0029354270|nr:glycosyltransferase [Alkalibacillus haloalkaliphilus]MDV2583314.1 glycosyltransferase [Alkalibacillus haloalkaliphilus]